MKDWKQIGVYLGRGISLYESSHLYEIEISDLSFATVLLWLNDHLWSKDEFIATVNSLIQANPLSVVVAGEHVEESFDCLLAVQSRLPSSLPHFMTGIINASVFYEIAYEFLIATYPSDERFDVWKEHLIIVVGDNQSRQEIVRSITQMVDELNS